EVRPVPSVLVGEKRLVSASTGGDLRLYARERQPPVRVDEGDARIDDREASIGRVGEDEMVRVDAAHEPSDRARPCRRTAAPVDQVPPEDRGIVLVRDVRVHADVTKHRDDVLLDVYAHHPIVPEGDQVY